MKTIYEANDGTQFETYEECEQYEFVSNYADILPLFANDDIRVWSSSCEKLNLSESLEKGDLETFFDGVFYVDFKTEKVRSTFEKFVYNHGMYLGVDDAFPFKSADFYYWDKQRECWYSFSALKGFIASLEEIRNSPSN